MALLLNNSSQGISAALANSADFTLSVWVRKAAGWANANGVFGMDAGRSLRWLSGSGIEVSAHGAPFINPANGDWVYLALIKSGTSNVITYGFTDVSAETLTTLEALQYIGAFTIVNATMGDDVAGYTSGANGAEYLHLRGWSSVLTSAQLNTEKNSATPVISTGLVLAASLTSALTAQTGTSPATTHGSGHTFTANVPASVGSGPTATPMVNPTANAPRTAVMSRSSAWREMLSGIVVPDRRVLVPKFS